MKRHLIALCAFAITGYAGADALAADQTTGVVEKLFVQSGSGATPRPLNKKLEEWASVTDYGADPTGIVESTAAFQKAIAANSHVFIPAGKYMIDPVAGIVVRTGLHMSGAGKNKTVLFAKTGGCTMAHLVSYSGCAMIRRQFNVAPGVNNYVNEVYLGDFAIVLNHPASSVTTTAIQIGIDLRNITRSIVERVHVGNVAPIGGAYTKASHGDYDVQGYGIVIGNVGSSQSSYAGGEVNTIRDSSVWGAYKLITIDDGILSPGSAAHATSVLTSDLQIGHHLLVQESKYTAGMAWRDNTIQSVRKQPGDASASYALRIEGYNNSVSGGYIEAGNAAKYLLYLGAGSKGNNIDLKYYSATNAALITDVGSKNSVEYFENTGTIRGGVDSLGAPLTQYDKALRRAWVKFHWSGSAIVIDGGQGATVIRTSAGDYTVTWTHVFPTQNYALSTAMDTDASGHLGGVSVLSHTASNVRIATYSQDAGVTAKIDPRYVWLRAEQ